MLSQTILTNRIDNACKAVLASITAVLNTFESIFQLYGYIDQPLGGIKSLKLSDVTTRRIRLTGILADF